MTWRGIATSGAVGWILILAAGIRGDALARTWVISPEGDGDAPTIQAGIDSAAAGDTVLALPGRFVENINFKGKAIVVSGSGRDVTTLDGSEGDDSCVLFITGEGHSSVLTRFTISGGDGRNLGGTRWGGGIFAADAAPTIRDNRIQFNEADYITIEGHGGGGGGLYLGSAGSMLSPRIEGNLICYNRAGGNGGGLGCRANVRPIVKDNIFLGNEAISGDGGGMWFLTYADGAVIEGNVIEENTAGDHGGGIQIVGERSSYPYVTYEIRGNLISGNLAKHGSFVRVAGGGIVAVRAKPWIEQNTIVGNDVWGIADTTGGGIGVDNTPEAIVERNIIALSKGGGGIFCYPGELFGTIRNNLAWQNVGGDGTGDCAAWWQSNGNVIENPQFCAPMAGIFTVAENSPALTHPAGPLGAFPDPECGPITVHLTTWGRLKALFR